MFYIYEKILAEQMDRAYDKREMFKSWVPNYDQLTPILQLQGLKEKSEGFISSCVNLLAKIKNSGVLKVLQKDRAAIIQQNKRDREEFEGYVLPDPHKALPGISFICLFVYSFIHLFVYLFIRLFVYSFIRLVEQNH